MADKIYLPKQKVRPGHGTPGYKGKNIVVVGSPAAMREEKASGKSGKK